MPGMNGHELLAQLQQKFPALPVLLMTAYGDIKSAVNAMREGAVDYLVKPFKSQSLVEAVSRYVKGQPLQDENQPVAESESSRQLLGLARRVAATDSTVLISGESGTGKEVLARYIHDQSGRAGGPFVAINCAAIPENMLEATLFGHEKGAFTGAYNSSAGKFEQANGGTLLLDEVSEMDIGLQAKLLRVLQEREVERVGGKKLISLDVRVIATTNRDLQTYVRQGQFREDLYYRLSVFPLQWRALRDRAEDILPLAQRLLAKHCDKMKLPQRRFDNAAQQALLQHAWPGNVRELENVVQRALILSQGEVIGAGSLMLEADPHFAAAYQTPTLEGLNRKPAIEAVEENQILEDESELDAGIRQHEYQLIINALRHERGRKKQAAEKLGISPRTLRYKMAKMRESGIDLDAAMRAC